MNINSTTIGATEGGIKIYLEDKEAYGVVNLNTEYKYIEKYVRDEKGQLVIHNSELQRECVPFETARIEFDNVVIEVK